MSPMDRVGMFIGLRYVQAILCLIVGPGLIVTAIVLFIHGEPAGVAALMFGVIFAGFGAFNVWLLVRLHRGTTQQPASDPSQSA